MMIKLALALLAVFGLSAPMVAAQDKTSQSSRNSSATPPATGGFVDIDEEDRAAIMDAVKQSLIDPDSAQFRWLSKRTAGGTYCGLVNAKNSYGGYTGFTAFSVSIFHLKNPTETRAALIGMGNGNPNSPQTRAIEITCAKEGLYPAAAR